MLKIFDSKSINGSENKLINKEGKLEQKTQPEPLEEETKNNFEFLLRVKLDVTVNAPLIILPENSSSSNALLLDCGLITMKTHLDILKNYYKSESIVLDDKLVNDRCKLPPVIEVQKVTLSNMEISRVILDKDLNIQNELFLVDCSELKVCLRRNLQPNIFKNIESISVEAIYGGLLLSLAKSDYSFIIQLLQNLNEKFKEDDSDLPTLPSTESAVPKKSKKSKITSLTELKDNFETTENQLSSIKSDLGKIVANISVKLFIESIQMYLHEEEYTLTVN